MALKKNILNLMVDNSFNNSNKQDKCKFKSLSKN